MEQKNHISQRLYGDGWFLLFLNSPWTMDSAQTVKIDRLEETVQLKWRNHFHFFEGENTRTAMNISCAKLSRFLWASWQERRKKSQHHVGLLPQLKANMMKVFTQCVILGQQLSTVLLAKTFFRKLQWICLEEIGVNLNNVSRQCFTIKINTLTRIAETKEIRTSHH